MKKRSEQACYHLPKKVKNESRISPWPGVCNDSPRVGNSMQNCVDDIFLVISDVSEDTGNVIIVKRKTLLDQVPAWLLTKGKQPKGQRNVAPGGDDTPQRATSGNPAKLQPHG